MASSFALMRALVCAASISFTIFVLSGFGQQATPTPPAPDQSEVVRISTELVQTGVVVLDKQRRFVEGLKPEQFQLRVDGKPVTISFFEHVVAGTAGEERLLAAAARGPAPAITPTPVSIGTTYRGRTIVFFIDDLHLSAQSVEQTRKAFLDFVENQMGPDDQVAVASPSGQLGFLQKFTDVKPVLRAAIARLSHRSYAVRDAENISMTEYTALKIDQGDRDAIAYYADELLKANNFRSVGGPLGPTTPSPYGGKSSPQPNSSGMSREMAERNIKERAQLLLKQSAAITINTLSALESLMRTSSSLPGRKLVFFISDGFYLNDRNTAFGDKLKQITDAAVRAGVVIYSMDARGLISMTDASSNRADPQGRLSRSNIGEISASQDPLTALAEDSGGRALLNSDALTQAVTNALKETSSYYLLAWRPDAQEQKGAKFKHLEVSIADRPDLTVRLPRGFFVAEPKVAAKLLASDAKPGVNPTNAEVQPDDIRAALLNATPKKGLPTQLSVTFVDVPNTGPVVTVSTQMATDILGYGADSQQTAAITLAGVVFNDQGKQVGGFKTRLNVNPSSQSPQAKNPSVIYSHKVPLKPGIYQVRVAAQDDNNGRVGSAAQWIEIPDLASKRLTLSSLLVGGQFIGSSQTQAITGSGQEEVQFSVNRRFAQGSHLNFLTFIYNAAPGTAAKAAPELETQIRISRNGQAIVTSPLQRVATDANTDTARIVYGADIALKTLPVGRYLLQVSVSDRFAKTSASQQVVFEIE